MPICEWCGEQTSLRDDLGLCPGCSGHYWHEQQRIQAEHDYYQAMQEQEYDDLLMMEIGMKLPLMDNTWNPS